jgi:Helix-turn-helix
MTGEGEDGTRRHIWRRPGGKRPKAWKDAYRQLAHNRGGIVRLGRKPDPPFDDEQSQPRSKALGNLGRACRSLREQQGLSVRDLAVAADVPWENIAATEAGQFDADVLMLLKLADGMGVRPARIFTLAEELDRLEKTRTAEI